MDRSSIQIAHLFAEHILSEPLGEGLVGLLQLLHRVLVLLQREALLGRVLELLALELGQRGDGVLVDGLRQVEHLVALLQQALGERERLTLPERRGWGVSDG